MANTPFESPTLAKNILGGLITATDAVVPAVLRYPGIELVHVSSKKIKRMLI